MRKRLRIVGLVGCGLVLVIAAGLGGLYWAFRQEPEFYRAAIGIDPAEQKQASDELLQRAAALRSDVEKEGQWRALFSAEQINGWLAVDLVENYPHALPKAIRDPRVEIRPDRMTLACRLKRGGVTSVVSLAVEPYLAETNVLALRIRDARAGVVPMPLAEVLEYISRVARELELPLRWRQAEGDPVALVSIAAPPDDQGRVVEIETIELGEGEIYLAGRTRQQPGGAAEAQQR